MAVAPSNELRKALDKFLSKNEGWRAFDSKPAVGAKPGGVGTGRPSAASAGGGGAFVESDYALREYWPATTITTSDGLFTLEIKPIKKIALEGGGAAEFKQPPTPAP